MAMDLVSGAEVPAEEIVVTPAMTEAGMASWLSTDPVHRVVKSIYRAMERARRAEANMKYGSDVPPPGYRNASEDEPERTPPPRGTQ
jgi:hypothetical protein